MANVEPSWRAPPARNPIASSAGQSITNPNYPPNNPSHPQQPHAHRTTGKAPGRAKKKRATAPQRQDYSHLPQLNYPIYNSQEIQKFWTSNLPPRPEWSANPKSILNNFCQQVAYPLPQYNTQTVMFPGVSKPLIRATVELDFAPDIIAIGDDPIKKEAEKIAALSACFQLGMKNMFDESNLPVRSENVAPDGKPRHLMPDGTQLTLDQAKAYMSFYCRKFNFGNPDIHYESSKAAKGRQTWIATIFVGGRKIGLGHAISKRDSVNEAYLDTVVYLGECDPALWAEFCSSPENQQASTGGHLPAVTFKLSNETEQDLRQIVYSSMDCELYRRAKTMLDRARRAGPAPPQANPSATDNANRRNSAKNPSVSRKLALEEKSVALKDRLNAYKADPSPAVVNLREQRKSLPVTADASMVLSALAANPITILMAATGSGKTTQVPQIILDDATMRGEGAKCNIICTQPRRIAAISVAQRVANERNEKLCESVGYQVRFEAKPPTPDGSILFCTTGIFLRRLQTDMDGADDGFLNSITHVVVDEVHERDIETDLLLFCLRRVLQDRKEKGKSEIKVLLMSATVDPTLFEQYFSDPVSGKKAPVISIPGRSFPVEKHFLEEIHGELLGLPAPRGGWVFDEPQVQKYLTRELNEPLALDPVTGRVLHDNDDLEMPYALVALIVAWVISKSTEGHVLVFLPGWEEIKGVQTILSDFGQYPMFSLNFSVTSNFEVHVLHSAIPVADQQLVFSPPRKGVRRIILSTNIAETSVTIPDVVFVVDTGKIKEKRFDPERHLSTLTTAWVGTSNLNQRAGRAGRHRPGDYYALLSKKRYNALNIHSTVEMKRTDLSNLVMHVKALNFPNMEAEDVLAQTIEPPERERVSAAMSHLQTIGALDRNKDLTALGRVLLQLPVEAQIGKLLLMGSFFKCLEPALNLAAILTNRDPFLAPLAVKVEANRIKSSWAPLGFRSDPLACLAAFKAWSNLIEAGETHKAIKFANDNFLSKPSLNQIAQVKTHLLASLRRAGVLAISGGGESGDNRSHSHYYNRRNAIPPHLNKNSDSLPLAAALIAVAVAPNFAVRKSAKLFATDKDRACMIHPSSVNSSKKEAAAGDDIPLQNGRQIFAFGEKSLQLPRPGAKGKEQMSLRSTTRLDPLGYMLFGARQLQPRPSGLQCDGWLPITGNAGALDDVERLKYVLDASLMRVFDGLQAEIMKSNPRASKRPPRTALPPPKRIFAAEKPVALDGEESVESDFEEDEDEDLVEVAPVQYGTLSRTEVQDLQRLTEEVVSLLNKYSEERLATDANTSRAPSRPDSRATNRPILNRLHPTGYGPDGGGGGGNSSAGPSRPGSRLNNRADYPNHHANTQNSWNQPGPPLPPGVPPNLPPGAGMMHWGSGAPGTYSYPVHHAPTGAPESQRTWQQQQQRRDKYPSPPSSTWG